MIFWYLITVYCVSYVIWALRWGNPRTEQHDTDTLDLDETLLKSDNHDSDQESKSSLEKNKRVIISHQTWESQWLTLCKKHACRGCCLASSVLQRLVNDSSLLEDLMRLYSTANDIPEPLSSEKTIRLLYSPAYCPFCQLIVKVLNEHGVRIANPLESIVLSLVPLADKTWSYRGQLKGLEIFFTAVNTPRRKRYFTKVAQHVSIQFARECLDFCYVDHDTCSLEYDYGLTKREDIPNYLIDLHKQCLVPTLRSMRYVALSYVWGKASHSGFHKSGMCTSDSLPLLKTQGYFKPSSDIFPAAIRDAMVFTKAVGERYLWIDCYCIVQDDEMQKHRQIQMMGSIYLHAYFTITAAEGSVSDGLPGVSTKRIPAVTSQTIQSSSGLKMNVDVKYRDFADGSDWGSRGWTLQEQLFSRRNFIFRKKCVIFVCQQSVWQEGTVEPTYRSPYDTHNEIGVPALQWPHLGHLKKLLEKFMVRELTYPCDSLDAFAGIFKSMENAFPGGFHYGLPELYFDISLLWQPAGILKDRIILSEEARKPIMELPSWSWARWQGPIDLSFWDAAEESLVMSNYDQNFCRVKQIVQWTKLDTELEAIDPVANGHEMYRACAWDISAPLPAGWKKAFNPIHASHRGWPGSLGVEFTHSSLLESECFRYPLPLGPHNEDHDFNEYRCSFISGRVQAAFLKVREPLPRTILSEGNDWWCLMGHCEETNTEVQIGVFLPHDPSSILGSNKEITYEFIAISLGEYRRSLAPGAGLSLSANSFSSWERWRMSDSNNFYSFYNVMMISRNGNFSERIGLGRVERSKWEGISTRDMTIILK